MVCAFRRRSSDSVVACIGCVRVRDPCKPMAGPHTRLPSAQLQRDKPFQHRRPPEVKQSLQAGFQGTVLAGCNAQSKHFQNSRRTDV